MASNIHNDVKLHNMHFVQTGTTPVNFRANSTNTLERAPEKDTIETKKEEKKGLSKLAIWGLGVASGLGTLTIALSLISKHKTKSLAKLYREKMTFKELPEKLEFKEAKTLDEAVKFAKEILGIKKIDKEITLDALNYVNRGIVDVSNANKGRLFIPQKLKYSGGNNVKYIASVNNQIKSKDFGSLFINKDFFTHEALNKKISESFIYKNGKKIFTEGSSNIYWNDIKAYYTPSTGFMRDLQNFYKSPESLSINQKRKLYWGYQNAIRHHEINSVYTPSNFYKLAIEQNGKQKYTLQEFKALNIDKQREVLKETLNKNPIQITLTQDQGLKTMYHEMGHLQDFAKNLKELDLKTWDFDIIKTFKEAWRDAKNKVKKENKTFEYVDNRWGGKTYDGYEKLLKNNPKKFQQKYPDLYKHLTDPEIQNITGQVSWYAQTSIGEFIAEVYAGLIQGKKYSNEVINLYKKYNGPLLPNM